MFAVELRDVSFAYNGKDVLEDVSLQVSEGAFLGVIGPNGSGKTTLLRLIGKTLTARHGRVLLQGRPVSRISQRECARLVAVVPQESEFAFPYTVEQVVLMGRYAYCGAWGLDSARDREIARKAMFTTDVLDFADRLVYELSGGEKQRVVIARALTQQPRILLLDEATSFLDIRHQTEIYEIVQKLNRENALTVISVEHNLNVASQFAQQLVLLDKGRIRGLGAPSEVITRENLREVFKANMFLGRNPRTGNPFVLPADSNS